jgi:anti-anti-sigma factor
MIDANGHVSPTVRDAPSPLATVLPHPAMADPPPRPVRAPFTLDIEMSDRISYVRLGGEVGAETGALLRAELDALIDGGERTLVLDLRSTHFFGTAGMRAVCHAAERLDTLHGSVRVVGASEKTRELLDLARESRPGLSIRI